MHDLHLVSIQNKITVTDPPDRLRQAIRTSLRLKNPLYYRLARMGNHRALYATREYFTYFEETDDDISFPRGMRPRLKKFIEKEGGDWSVEDKTVRPALAVPAVCHSPLRDYQYGVIEEINPTQNPEGVIVLSTGFGKSFIALKLIECVQTKTLIIVPRNSILKQFRRDIELHLRTKAGIIQGKNEDIQDITVASLATLRKRPDLRRRLKKTFGMVVVDECHQTIPQKSIEAVTDFQPRFFYGLTATPARDDGQGEAIHFYYGPTLITRELPQETPQVVRVHSPHFLRIHENYALTIDDQVEHEARNQLIARYAEEAAEEGRKVLVLTKRIAHYEAIGALIGGAHKTLEIPAKDLPELLPKIRSGEQPFDILLGTFSLLSTGVDIPILDTLIIAGDLKSSVLTKQSIGRVLRLHETKKTPKIIDFVDKANGILMNQAKQRAHTYRKNDWPILDIHEDV